MLKVVRVGDPRRVSVESDECISLAVDWVRAGSVRPVYYRVSGDATGDVEIKLEPHTGEVIGLVVIEPPTERIAPPNSVDEARNGSVFVDLTEWSPNPDLSPQREVVHDKQALAMGETEDRIYYSWLRDSPDDFVWSANVGLGISAGGLLTGVLVLR